MLKRSSATIMKIKSYTRKNIYESNTKKISGKGEKLYVTLILLQDA